MSPSGKAWLGWALLGLLVVAIVFGSTQGADPGREPGRSSQSEAVTGFAGWAQLLRGEGVDVERLESPPSGGGLSPRETVVALDIGSPTRADSDALSEFVDSGGRLIIGGDTSPGAIGSVLGGGSEPLRFEAGGPARPLLAVEETAGVASVTSPEPVLWRDRGTPSLPVLGTSQGALLLLAAPESNTGQGGVALLADSAPLANRQLPSSDNALFAINLATAGGRDRVVFLESLASEGRRAEGPAALPSSWRWGFGGLLLAGLVLIASRLRRLGPPDGVARARAEPRTGYVEAMARILARTKAVGEAAEPVREAALEGMARRSGGERARDADMLAAQAEQTGVPREEAEVLLGKLDEPGAAIKAARALGRVWR